MTTELTFDDVTFDLFGDLPTGTSILEASAGTGKTFTITTLATRCIAEGMADISELLVITFTNAATSELRDRVRRCFTKTAAALVDVESARASDDELVAFLAKAPDDEVERRRLRLARAVSDFDEATIVTTLSFCQRMLEGLGIVGDRDPYAQFVEEPEDLQAETLADMYISRFANDEARPSWKAAKDAVDAAIQDLHATIVDAGPADTVPGKLWRLAKDARTELERRKRLVGVRDYDDLLVLLAETIRDPDVGDIACERIRSRFRVALIDEFQDTDPLQWEIVERIFHGEVAMVLVGDPKQAIYGFRGADVRSYLAARRKAQHPLKLGRNYRSDRRLLDALHYLWGGASLGENEIVVSHVEAEQVEPRLDVEHPVRLRYLTRLAAGNIRYAFPSVDAVRPVVAADVAADLLRLFESGTQLDGRPVEPGDVAVLVRTHKEAEAVRAALDELAIPSVLAGSTSVFDTDSAKDWHRVLRALEQPHRAGLVRLAALTPILGWTPAQLDAAGDAAIAQLGAELRDLAATAATAGFAAMYERMSVQYAIAERLLKNQAGERRLTDIRHIAEALNRASVEESLGLVALVRWMGDRANDLIDGAKDRSRRLDRDAAAVQIATVHTSKGLEFPIVYVPFSYDNWVPDKPVRLNLHHGDERLIDVGGPDGVGYDDRLPIHQAEDIGSQLRLFYVALTRAKCQLVLWWAPTYNTANAPLQRMLFGRERGEAGTPRTAAVLGDDRIDAKLRSFAEASSGLIAVEQVTGEPVGTHRLARTVDGASELRVAEFTRTLDHAWRRTSYTALTAAAHDAPHVSSESEEAVKDDEPESDVAAEAEGTPSPMNQFAGGTAFGTLVHEILEYVDTSADDLATELRLRCREAVSSRLAALDPDALADALHLVMRTPLGFGTLADIAPGDRLAELDFELPLEGGSLDDIVALFRKHIGPGDPLASYADELVHVGSTPLRGFLTGSIDAVLRLPDGTFVVVDYKTNRIGTGELTVGNYAPEPMAAAMMQAHYPLQAILYCVALHRYLRWRLAGYDPAKHLGGVQYHFVRGMIGPDTPPEHGVFRWHPPAAMIVELSDVLGGRA